MEHNNKNTPAIILTLDAEKAFDRVNWGFRIETLINLGIGPKMMHWIGNLYNKPSVKIKVNGTISSPIETLNGTRQGCPLSPHLYIISLEPLLATVRRSGDIGGVKEGREEHKVAAYADDIRLYITNPRITLPNIIKELKRYRELSNLKINPTKSEILNINLSKEEERALQKEFQFTWVKKEIKYLGIRLTANLEDLYHSNLIPLLNEIKTEIKKIAGHSLFWFGRINILKMVFLPKILYKIQMLPLKIPQYPTIFL